MIKKYLGFYFKEEETGRFSKRKKKIYGDLTVEADSFAEAQERICKRMGDYNIEVCMIFPVWKEF